MEYVIVFYDEYGYTVFRYQNGEIIKAMYAAGNNKNSSATTDSVSPDDHNCLSLKTIKKFAQQTGRQIARNKGIIFMGVQYDESHIEE